MRISSNTFTRLCIITALFLFFLQLPTVTVARNYDLVKNEVQPFCYGWCFGEPGHDPFSRGGEPGGNEEQNRNHGFETILIPGPDNGNCQNSATGTSNKIIEILDFYGKEFIRLIESLI